MQTLDFTTKRISGMSLSMQSYHLLFQGRDEDLQGLHYADFYQNCELLHSTKDRNANPEDV